MRPLTATAKLRRICEEHLAGRHEIKGIDLLVTDAGPPGGMNGRQTVDAARTTRPDLAVPFITGHAENAVFIHGPFEPGMFVTARLFALDTLADLTRSLISAEG